MTTIVLLVALLATLVPFSDGAAPAHAGLFDVPEIEIGPDGFTRGASRMQLRAGDVVWRNGSGGPLTITSPNGLLESGVIPDGGAFVARLDYPGSYAWETELVRGIITIPGRLATGDGPDAPAVDAIPALAFPPRDADEIVEHPLSGMPVSRSRMLVGFTDDATVSEASAALSSARVEIVGGLPRLGIVLVDRGSSFAQTQIALERLRTEPAVAFASAEFLETDATLPAPSRDLIEPYGWTWDSPADHPLGRLGNWGLELSRVPAAWNLNETTQRRLTRPVDIAVVDSGFEAHEDLSRLQQLELCRTELQVSGIVPLVFNCTRSDPSDHGNHVAGIIGADHDNRTADGRSIGGSGVDPFSNLIGINRRWETTVADGPGDDALDASQPQALEELLAAAEEGTVPDLRVINSSNELLYGGTQNWIMRWADETCGPGPDDDADGVGPCLPDTQDDHLAEIAEYGKLSRRIVERFIERLDPAPVFVASSGNLSNDLCVPLASPCVEEERAPIAAIAGSSLAWAAANWRTEAGPSPIVVVESIGVTPGGSLTPSTARSSFSNVGGDISAPGLALSASSSQTGSGASCPGAGADGYCYLGGTSQAAPFVSGALGLWLSYDPSLTPQQLRSLLLDWAIDDTTDGAAPRIDVFRPLQSLPGAAQALADLSDPSPDGNRRVVRAADGTTSLDTQLSTEPDALTDPDGAVDMRDFRRFRDAWLAQCLLDGGEGCPDTILLDGPVDHPKRDLNGDGCIGWVPSGPDQSCPSETVFNRFDLNGDGVVSRTRTASVGITAAGEPASGRADATEMTDLEVLAAQWDADADGAETVLPTELDDLLVSGDLELHLDGLDASGATEAVIEVVDARDATAASLWTRTVPLDGNPRTVTVPAGVPVELRIGASGADASLAVRTPAVTLAAGEDRRLDACGTLFLDAGPAVLEQGGTTTVQAEILTCGASAAGIEIALDLELSADGVATVTPATLTTDADGRASATLTAGDLDGVATIVATADVPTLADATTTVSRTARATLRVGAPYDLETLAIEDAGGGWDLADPQALAEGEILPTGTSINRHGDVVFTARAQGNDHDDVFLIPGDQSPAATEVPFGLRRSGAEMTAGQRVRGAAQVNDDGTVAVVWSRLDGGVLRSELRRYTADDTEVLVTGEASIGAPDTDYGLLDHPTLSNTGQVVVRATRNSDDADVLLSTQLAGISEGAETPFARPRVADDGTVVTPAVTDEGRTDDRGLPLLETLLLVGDGDHANGRQVLARTGAGQPWRSIGDAHLSDQGRAVVFVGDRGDGPGLFLSLRGDDDTWSEPLPVLGENATAPTGELGTDNTGSPRFLADVVGQPGVVEVAHDPEGGAAGRLLLAFRGTANLGVAGAAATENVWTVPVDIARTDGDPSLTVGIPTPVLGVGASLAGSTVAGLRLHDPIAVGGVAAGVDAHRLALGVRLADDRLAVLRADWLGGPVDLGAAGGAASSTTAPAGIEGASVRIPVAGADDTAEPPLLLAAGESEDGSTVASAEALAATDVAEVDGPHIAAMTLAPIPRDLGDTYTVVNRSRLLDGTPAAAVFDARILAPDEAVTRTLPLDASRTFALQLGAPIMSSPWTSIVTVRLSVGVGPEQPPVADAGGPYATDGAVGLRLDPGGSSPSGAEHAWDLDGDGVYELDGSSQLRPTDLTGDQVTTAICGGTCVEDDTYTIGLEVSSSGGASTDTAEVTITGPQDFTLLVNPQTARIDPGQQSDVWLTLDPVDGFSGAVELSLEGVPDGWSVTHAPTAVVPSFVGLRIRPPANAPTDQLFTFDVVATAGDLERRAEVRVATAGLLRERSAALSGTLTDADTGAPLGGLSVRTELGNHFVPEGGDGSWATTLQLSPGSEVERITVEAELLGYAPFRRELLISEGDNAAVDIALEPYDRGAVTARVVTGRFNPVDPRTPIPTGTPLEGIAVEVSDIDHKLLTGTDGRFTSPADIRILDPAEPRSVTVSASADGYWTSEATGLVRGGELLDLGDLALLEKCDATLGEVRVVDQLGDPVAGSRVAVNGLGISERDVTDDQGRIVFDSDVLLPPDHVLLLTATALGPTSWPGDAQASTVIRLQGCGDRSADATIVLERPEVLNPTTGAAEGTVTDAVTDLPIAGATLKIETRDSVFGAWGSTRRAVTDEQGRWARTDLRVFAGSTTAYARVQVAASGYVDRTVEFAIETDGTTTVDVALPPQRFGDLEGVVRDIDTGEPVPGVSMRASSALAGGADITDANGRYRITDLPTALVGGRGYLVEAQALYDPDTLEPRYWSALGAAILFPDTTTTLDLNVLEACLQGTVSGVVRDAESDTLEPIEGARVSIGNLASFTDTDGRYRIEGVPVAVDNGSNNVTITAEKEGFVSASTSVRVYCGAEITADFGGGGGGTGVVTGTVTDPEGDPVEGVFIGSGWGEAATTQADGTYQLDDAPLATGGGQRDWVVSARFRREQQDADVTVTGEAPTIQDFVVGVGNRPPQALDQTVETTPGRAIAVALDATDPDADPLARIILTQPEHGRLRFPGTMGEGPLITYRPDDGFIGTDVFTFVVDDGLAISDAATITVTVVPTVEPPNTPPTADDLTLEVDAGSTVGVTLTGAGGDGDALTFEVVSQPDVGSLTGTAPDLTYTAPADASGEVTFTYQASDGTDVSDPATVTITVVPTVEPPNSPPSIDPIADVELDEGDTESVAVAASDPEGDPITISAVAAPEWAALADAGDGTAEFLLAPMDDGQETIEVQACTADECVSTSFVVTVRNVAPTLTVPTPDAIDEGSSVSVTATAQDPGADELAFTIDCGDGFGAPQPAGVFTCGFDQDGIYPVTVRVVDGDGGEDEVSVDATVRNVTPSVTASNDGPKPWGVEVRLDAVATDPSPEDQAALTFRWDLDADGTYDTDPSTAATATAVFDEPGEQDVVVQVCDDDACSEATTTVTVTARPTSIEGLAAGPAQYSDPVELTATLIDEVSGDPISGAGITLGFDGVTVAAVTDSAGEAADAVLVDRAAGVVTATATFAGDNRYEATSEETPVTVVQEGATLRWRGSTVVLGSELQLEVDVVEDDDGYLGDIGRAAVTFLVYDGDDCATLLLTVDPVPVDDGEETGDGIGTATAAVEVEGRVCVEARLTGPDDPTSPNGHYAADPVEAEVEVLTTARVTGGGRLDGTVDRLNVGFVAAVSDGVPSGNVEVVGHPDGRGRAQVLVRSTEITAVIVTDAEGTGEAPWRITIRGEGERRTADGWESVTFELQAIDGGPGRGVDRVLVLVDGEPYAPVDGEPVPGPLSGGQIVVHLPPREE